MALNLGQLLGGAGIVASRQRQAEEAERVARTNQLAIEEQNRLETLRRMPRPEIGAAPGIGDLSQFRMDVSEIAPAPAARPAAPAPAPAPTAAAPTTAAAPSAGDYYENIYGRLKGSKNVLGMFPSVSKENLDALRDPNKFTTEEVARIFTIAVNKGDQATAAPLYEVLRFRGVSEADLRNIQRQSRTGVRLVQEAEAAQTAADEKQRKAFELKTGRKVGTATTGEVLTPGLQVPPAATKVATTYDNKTTPYDALIQQSAQQYGIDPVVFKRLLGTESSFKPDAVSPRGEKFGLGIAQIADVHGLTREQRLDPNVAIPFAAQLFAQYLEQNDGDYAAALEQYKGATSAGGKAAMAKPIGDILSGIVATAEAAPAAGVAPTAPAAPAAARQMKSSDFYMGNPQAVSRDMQVALQNREELRRMAMMYRDAGLTNQYDAMRQQVMQLDQGLFYLSGMQGIQQLMSYRDPRMLSAVISQSTGTPTGIRPRTDNLYDIVANPGTENESLISQGVPAEQIAAYAQELFDPSVRAARTELAQFAAKEEIKGRAGVQTAIVKATADIQAAIVKGEYDKAVELAKQNKGELKFDTASGRWAFVKGNDVRIIDPNEGGEVETPLGTIMRAPTARRITGLNFGQ